MRGCAHISFSGEKVHAPESPRLPHQETTAFFFPVVNPDTVRLQRALGDLPVPRAFFVFMTIVRGEDCMPKLGIAIDKFALRLLRQHAGSPRRVGALISTLIRQYDFDEAYGSKNLQHQLNR